MAEEKKKREEVFISPKGVAKFIQVTSPSTKFKPEGEYQVRMLLDPTVPDNQAFVAKVKKAHADAVTAFKKDEPKKAKTMTVKPIPIKDDEDKDGAPTGNGLLATFKAKASGTYKDKRTNADGSPATWSFKPEVSDAKGVHLKAGVLVYGGSVIKVAYSIKHTAMPTGEFYTSLSLKGVRVLKLSDAPTRSYFGAAEEGYTEDETDTSNGVGDGEQPTPEDDGSGDF